MKIKVRYPAKWENVKLDPASGRRIQALEIFALLNGQKANYHVSDDSILIVEAEPEVHTSLKSQGMASLDG